MQTLESSASLASLSENQRNALISLLADDDPAVYHLIRSKLLSYGPGVSEWLRPQTLSSDPKMRRRATEILSHQAREANDERFLQFCRRNGEDLDLEEAVGWLARTRYPEANHEAYGALLDTWASELRERIDPRATAQETLAVFNRFFFEELSFSGNDHYGYEPECCYVNRIVDKRSGNPIGLCAIYLFLARRLRLPITGIGLPGHFVCRYQSSTAEVYIDCFRKGVFLTKADCIKYLLQANYGLAEGHLAPISAKRILLRMCNNLVNTYGHLEMTQEAARVQRYVAALSR
jgi:regulator of sirC expression with transglutaminase-like and TPR domain